jgi:hypothetical protein
MDEKLKRILDDHEKRLKNIESILKGKPKDAVKKRMSIKEFIISKQPKNDVQKTLTIAYYLEKYSGLQFYNARDLTEGFRAAKEPVPKNINYKVIKNIKKGYMMETSGKKDGLKTWVLTNSGEKYVENNFRKEQKAKN